MATSGGNFKPLSEKQNVLNEKKTNRSVCYIFSDEYHASCNRMVKIIGRASLTHSLIAACGLLSHMKLVCPKPAKREDVELFHSGEYLDCLKKLSDRDDDEKYGEDEENFGLTYDCPAWRGVYEYSNFICGASVKAAQALVAGFSTIAINWPGGWHHAKRDEASGFCYMNDIAVAILKLKQKFNNVLYVDLDLHHGDGVEDAFCATAKVMTVSFHKCSPGFFPGRGYIDEIGIGRGKYYTVNVPLLDGVRDEQFIQVFQSVMSSIKECYKPEAIVCQCGADALVGDPHNAFNLTEESYIKSVQYLMDWNVPLLLVGGGGYNLPNTARCWTQITAAATGRKVSTDIPEHRYFTQYGPDYEFPLEAGNMRNKNDNSYIEEVLSTIHENLSRIKERNPSTQTTEMT